MKLDCECVENVSARAFFWGFPFSYLIKLLVSAFIRSRHLQEKFIKVNAASSKIEALLNNTIHSEINNAIDKPEKKVKIEYLIVKCKGAFTSVVDTNDELIDLAQKSEDQDTACENLEEWFENENKRNEEFNAAADVNNGLVQDKET